jgi:hypothetical protein
MAARHSYINNVPSLSGSEFSLRNCLVGGSVVTPTITNKMSTVPTYQRERSAAKSILE